MSTTDCLALKAALKAGEREGGPDHRCLGAFFANVPQCSRKDLRNAVEAAAKAGAGWAKRSPYNRAQILYRLAEMLEARSAEMASALMLDGTSAAEAKAEVAASIDRVDHYAGWADKYEQVLGSVNPVASSHFNFTVSEPMSAVGVIASDKASLLGLLSMILPVITAGNSVIALASQTAPYPAILLGEMLATSDLPGGVVNLLTGQRKDVLATFATHAHIRALSAVATKAERTELQIGGADSVKRLKFFNAEDALDWTSEKLQGVYEIRAFVEVKTVWHPIGA